MKYFTIAFCFIAALFIAPLNAEQSTDTSTFEFGDSQASHAPRSMHYSHNSFWHRNTDSAVWENHMKFFDHIVNNIDERISYLNQTVKVLYSMNCSNAFTRPDECTKFAKILTETIQHDRNNAALYCPFNAYHHMFKHAHDNDYHFLPKNIHQYATALCGHYKPENSEQVDWLIATSKDYLDTGIYQSLYKRFNDTPRLSDGGTVAIWMKYYVRDNNIPVPEGLDLRLNP